MGLLVAWCVLQLERVTRIPKWRTVGCLRFHFSMACVTLDQDGCLHQLRHTTTTASQLDTTSIGCGARQYYRLILRRGNTPLCMIKIVRAVLFVSIACNMAFVKFMQNLSSREMLMYFVSYWFFPNAFHDLFPAPFHLACHVCKWDALIEPEVRIVQRIESDAFQCRTSTQMELKSKRADLRSSVYAMDSRI